MPAFVLIDATAAYWWLPKGGFGRIGEDLSPAVYPTEQAAQAKAAELKQAYDFDLTPTLLRLPSEVKRRK